MELWKSCVCCLILVSPLIASGDESKTQIEGAFWRLNTVQKSIACGVEWDSRWTNPTAVLFSRVSKDTIIGWISFSVYAVDPVRMRIVEESPSKISLTTEADSDTPILVEISDADLKLTTLTSSKEAGTGRCRNLSGDKFKVTIEPVVTKPE